MVLWEITLATAYFLGLKRTYRLALKIQRRLISPKRQKIRQFVHRRTRAIFDLALKVHRNIQERDIEVGRNLGNWILRWLDKKRPQAQIRAGHPQSSCNAKTTATKQLTNSSHQKIPGGFPTSVPRTGERDSGRHLFSSTRNVWPKAFPAVAMIMRHAKPAGSNTQYRHFCISSYGSFELQNRRLGAEGLIRKDILQWMRQN